MPALVKKIFCRIKSDENAYAVKMLSFCENFIELNSVYYWRR